MNAFLATTWIMKILQQKRRTFLITGFVSGITGILLSYLIPAEYQSETILLPARHFSISKILIEPNAGNQGDYLELGDDNDLEKLLQILYSDELKIALANHLNLWKRWRIENKEYRFYYLKNKWEHYIHIHRTNYGAVRIKVYDRHPDTAALIANTLTSFIDTIQKNMTAERINSALQIVKKEYEQTIQRINQMEDSLNTLRSLGIYDYKEQVKAFSKEYAKALAKNNLKEKKQIEKLFETLQKYGGAYNTWSENLRKYRAKFAVIKYKYDQMLIDATYVLPLKYTIQKGIPNNKKARPIPWLIVLITVLSSEILVLTYYLIQSKKHSS